MQTYFDAMLDFARQTTSPVVLVSYERAANRPAKFLNELVEALRLSPTIEQTQNAIDCITGDGGGYTHLPEHWHHVELVKVSNGQKLTLMEPAAGLLGDIQLVSQLAPVKNRDLVFKVDVDFNAPLESRWVQLLVDFGEGFNGMNTYNLYPNENMIRLQHNGNIQRVAFGLRPGCASVNTIWIVRQ